MELGSPTRSTSGLHDHIVVACVEKHQGVTVQEPDKPQQSPCKVPDRSPGSNPTSLDSRAGGQVGPSIPCSRESHHWHFPQCSCVAQAASSDPILGRAPSPLSATSALNLFSSCTSAGRAGRTRFTAGMGCISIVLFLSPLQISATGRRNCKARKEEPLAVSVLQE